MPNELVVRPASKTHEIAEKALGRDTPTEARRVRRGKFFLSNFEQDNFGSFFHPIFEHYCHGVQVGETQQDTERQGIWVFAAHNDFDLIPEFQPPSTWPEYVRTHTGWKRADQKQSEESTARVDYLLSKIQDQKRLQHEGENK